MLVKAKMVSKPAEEILRAVYLYRYITTLDVTYLFYSPNLITYARSILSELCGGADFQVNQYLYRFPLPQFSSGRTEKVYTLGTAGRNFLTHKLGLSVDWYFKPQKVKYLTYGFVIHTLTLTRFLVAAQYFVKNHPDFKITKLFTSYELEREGLKTITTVIPDAWILFERNNQKHPILLEIDRGTEHKQQFKKHVRARIEFIRSGAYKKIFDIEAVMIIYANTGQLPQYQETRRKVMCKWTYELLGEMDMLNWSPIFRFCGLDWNHLYQSNLFVEPVWFVPGKDKPVTLFEG